MKLLVQLNERLRYSDVWGAIKELVKKDAGEELSLLKEYEGKNEKQLNVSLQKKFEMFFRLNRGHYGTPL